MTLSQKLVLAIVTLLVSILFAQQSNAQVTIDLTGTPGSSTVNIAVSGTFSSSGPPAGFNLGVASYTFPGSGLPSLPGSLLTAGSIVATNDDTLGSSIVDEIAFTNTPSESITLFFANSLLGTTGDTFSLAGSGAFDLSGGATFDDFTQGAFNGSTFSGGTFGILFQGNSAQLNISSQIPEPSTAAIAACTLALASRRQRRR